MESGSSARIEQKVSMGSVDTLMTLFGSLDGHVQLIENELNVTVSLAGDSVSIIGEADKVSLAAAVIEQLKGMVEQGLVLDNARIRYVIDMLSEGKGQQIQEAMNGVVAVTYKGRPVKCKTIGQKEYVKAIRSNTVVLCVGPAGTGKTYLAIAMAVVALKNKEVSRIILTRPAVEAGEKLGFLPGDLQNKVDPYLRPLYDALYEFMGADNFQKNLERGAIEVAPLAYMRGRTLGEAFIILDEAQNCTSEQMKMFLTRFGEGSKVVVTGDVTQIDLPKDKMSGLVHASSVLKDIEGLQIVRLTGRDVVRHEMVQRIIRKYEQHESGQRRREGSK
ncbi:MAG: PhoH family protein [Christensenellales bacterium]